MGPNEFLRSRPPLRIPSQRRTWPRTTRLRGAIAAIAAGWLVTVASCILLSFFIPTSLDSPMAGPIFVISIVGTVLLWTVAPDDSRWDDFDLRRWPFLPMVSKWIRLTAGLSLACGFAQLFLVVILMRGGVPSAQNGGFYADDHGRLTSISSSQFLFTDGMAFRGIMSLSFAFFFQATSYWWMLWRDAITD